MILDKVLNFIHENDKLVVIRSDRLARSVRYLTNITEDLQTKQVSFLVLEQQLPHLPENYFSICCLPFENLNEN